MHGNIYCSSTAVSKSNSAITPFLILSNNFYFSEIQMVWLIQLTHIVSLLLNLNYLLTLPVFFLLMIFINFGSYANLT